MIITDSLIKGFLIGISVAMAIGPIALLCIQRTLSNGFTAGFTIGLGAALADSLYGFIAVAGLAVISEFLITYEGVIAGIGSLILLYMAYGTMKSKPENSLAAEIPKSLRVSPVSLDKSLNKPSPRTLVQSLISSFFLTLSSPMTILLFTAIFTGMDLITSKFEYDTGSALIMGVFLGSTIWWLILSGVIKMIRNKLSHKSIAFINKVSSVILFGFAGCAIYKATKSLLIPM